MRKQDRKLNKRERIDEKNLLIEYFDVIPFMKQKQRRKKMQERNKNKELK